MVRPAFTFGHFLWGSTITTKTLKLKLAQLQAEALRLCGHFWYGTPRAALDVLLNVPPLDLYIKFEVGRSYHRLRGTLGGKLYPPDTRGHHRAAKQIFESARLQVSTPDFCELRAEQKRFLVKNASLENGKLYEDRGRLRIFTDGSRSGDGQKESVPRPNPTELLLL